MKKTNLETMPLNELRALAVAEYEATLGPVGQYVHITFTEGGTGRTRRSFALPPKTATQHLVTYRLVTRDGEETGESVIGFATDSAVVVKAARMNLHYGQLDIVRNADKATGLYR